MNAVKISVLLTVFCFLFTAMPCYAAAVLPHEQTSALRLEIVSEDNDNSLLGSLEAIGNSAQIGNGSGPVYSINAYVRDPEIIGGQTLQIEIYLSGFGIPKYDKLYINWTAPHVIDQHKPGNWTVFGQPGGTFDSTSAHSEYIIMGGFLGSCADLPQGSEDVGLNLVCSEHDQDGEPPILINLNTVKGAVSGHYQVQLTFTYGNETNLKQDYKEIQFHVISNWERSQQRWVTIGGLIVASVALLIAIVVSIWQMVRWCKGCKERKSKGRVKGSR